MLVIKNVVLEGPDCSGKTTLYSNIHKSTKFKWNIQDRSQLSMLCYARQFGRGDSEVKRWRRELRSFLLDLNNRLIVLLPDFQVIAQRLSERGDDVQDIESLRILHSIFEEETDRLGHAPNLLVVRNPMSPHDLMQHCVFWLTKAEALSPLNVAREVRQLADTMPNREAVGCRFQLTVDPSDLTCTDPAVMRHPPEETYYAKILAGVIQNMEDELAGRNEYCVKQDQYRTRRFIFTQSSCISLVHTMIRGDSINMKVYCRSSNVEETFRHDLQFICYLYGRVYARLATKCGWTLPPRGVFTIDVELGSAHIV